jgi:NADH-quinone oxidoreductase subunit G
MPKIFIDGQALEIAEGLTVLRAAESAGIDIPHFCYHPAFAPEGSCRMCLVEIEGLPKLELACSTLVKEGLKISTKSARVIEARKGVLEFLLAEHPLDCPICDKAGECKLQDYFEEYGLFEGRFKEAKEKREKKNKLSQKLVLDRERCILCTRCVRFLGEITGTADAGIVNRGNHCEVDIYESEFIDNNYAGNLVDLCPVGAITDRDFRFKTRVWFLEKRASICTLCSRGCSIFIDSHPGYPRVVSSQRIYRIRPRENPDVNRHWICDLGRYGYAELDKGRLDTIIQKKGEKETELSWDKTLHFLAEKINSLIGLQKRSRISVILHSGLSNEELFLAKKVFQEGLQIENVYVADQASSQGDHFLLTAERTPNRRGLQEIGLSINPPDLKILAEKTDFLLIFGIHLSAIFNPADLRALLDKIEVKALFSSHQSVLDSLVDIVIPTPVICEKSGSLTNVDGRVQRFSPAVSFQARGVAEWQALVDLAKELKINDRYFWQLQSPESIYQAMCQEIPFFK